MFAFLFPDLPRFQTCKFDQTSVENLCRLCQAGIMQELRFQPKAPETNEERAERLQKDLHKHVFTWTASKCSVRDGAYCEQPICYPFLGSALIQQNHTTQLGITAIGFELGFHMTTRVHWSAKLAIMAGHRERAGPKSSPEPLP